MHLSFFHTTRETSIEPSLDSFLQHSVFSLTLNDIFKLNDTQIWDELPNFNESCSSLTLRFLKFPPCFLYRVFQKNVSDFKRQFNVSKLKQSNVVLLTMANLCPWDVAAAPHPSPTQPLRDATLRATGYSNRWREPTIVIRNPYPLNTAFNCFAPIQRSLQLYMRLVQRSHVKLRRLQRPL